MSVHQLAELAEIETRYGEKTVDELRRAANILLRRQFVFPGDRGTAGLYELLSKNRHRSYFVALFDALGYEFLHDEFQQWIGIVPDMALDCLPRMRMDHTVVLLLLALMWQEGVNQGAAESRALVVAGFNDIFERYRDIIGHNRKEAVKESRLLEILKEFRQRALVEIDEFDAEIEDYVVTIRPMVARLIEGHALEKLERFALDIGEDTAETDLESKEA